MKKNTDIMSCWVADDQREEILVGKNVTLKSYYLSLHLVHLVYQPPPTNFVWG